MQLPVIEAERFLQYNEDTYMPGLFNGKNSRIIVKCFDGEVETTRRHVAFAWAYFLYNKQYNVPISAKQIVHYKVNPTDGVHFELSSIALKHIDVSTNHVHPLATIAQTELKVIELQINSAIRYLEEHAMSIDAEDYYQLHSHPRIKAARDKMRAICESDVQSIEKYHAICEAYSEFDSTIYAGMDDEFLYNGLTGLFRCASTKLTQLHQGCVARGFESEVNSNFYAEPVLASFFEGLKDPYSFNGETRSGAKAAMYTGDIMGDTEYLHRLVQMVAASFQRIHLMDCGSTVTYDFKVEEKYLPYIVGKYHLEDGVVKEITKKDPSLIGKTLKFRFPAGCAVADRGGCCQVCCGAVSKALAHGVNAGHTAGTKTMGTGSQKVLSVKHDDLGSLGNSMRISKVMETFLHLSPNGREVIYNPKGNMVVRWKMNMCPNLPDIYSYTGDTAKLNIPEFSKVGQISFFEISNEFDAIEATDFVGSAAEVVNFSPEFLNWLREDRQRLQMGRYNRTAYYSVDLSRFPKGTPMFITPFKHFDMIDQHKMTKAFLYSTRKSEVVKLTDFSTFGAAANAALDITMDKLGINLSVLEMTIYAFTVSSIEDRDYRPVRHSNACQFLPMDELYLVRSIAPKLIAERQIELLKSPLAVTVDNRLPHPYDTFCM